MDCLLLHAFIVLLLNRISETCRCVVSPGTNHLQTNICNSQISFIGNVVEAVRWGHTSVKIKKNIKGNYKKGETIFNISPGWNKTSCFPTFRQTEEYLFTAGSAQYGVGSCDLVMKTLSLTQQQIKFLNGIHGRKRFMYTRNCGCKITTLHSTSKDTCVLPSDFQKRHCLYNKGICLRGRNKCVWRSSSSC